MIHLAHDLTASAVLVVGGGPVARRRASLFGTEATVYVLATTFTGGDWPTCHRVRLDLAPADVGDWLDRIDPALVVAATDDLALNDAIEGAASDRGILVNRADETNRGDPNQVAVPATFRDGPVVCSVSTSGASPVLSRFLRNRIKTAFDDLGPVGEMAELTGELRADLAALGIDPERRSAALTDVVTAGNVWVAFRTASANPRTRAESVIRDVTGESL